MSSPVVPQADPLNTRSERPWLFAFLIAPMAVLSNGILGGALSYLYRVQGVGPARASEILALFASTQTIYFLWSPITDFWVRRRTWLIVGATASGILLYVAFRQPHLDNRWAIALLFVSACFGQLIVSSCGGMMGTLRNETNRRRASAFYQGGSLGFGAAAIFVLTYFSDRLSVRTLGLASALMIALPSLVALSVQEPDVIEGRNLSETFSRIWHEFKGTFFRWKAIPYTLCMIFPMGSGAMLQLLATLAVDYHVSAQQVAWINGIGGALLTAAGAFAATLIPTRVRAPVAYLSICLINEATLAVLWLGPLNPAVYLAGTVLFLFSVGACYALFTAVVLEFLGGSGKSGSSRYSIINSLGNIPVAYMVLLDGKGYEHWGPRGMPAADVILGAIGGIGLLGYFLTRRKPAAEQELEVATH
jgi:MFS transporter, PAT family, beta-lactamase induction signal transducer AmpG